MTITADLCSFAKATESQIFLDNCVLHPSYWSQNCLY